MGSKQIRNVKTVLHRCEHENISSGNTNLKIKVPGLFTIIFFFSSTLKSRWGLPCRGDRSLIYSLLTHPAAVFKRSVPVWQRGRRGRRESGTFPPSFPRVGSSPDFRTSKRLVHMAITHLLRVELCSPQIFVEVPTFITSECDLI